LYRIRRKFIIILKFIKTEWHDGKSIKTNIEYDKYQTEKTTILREHVFGHYVFK